jgi:hypothetical protein
MYPSRPTAVQGTHPRDHNQRPPGTFLDVDALCHQLETKGNEWADEKSAADALDDSKKAVLAQCLLDADGKTVGEREARALTDDRYQAHLDAIAKARKKANRALVAYEVAKVRVELTRSNASTERALAQLR